MSDCDDSVNTEISGHILCPACRWHEPKVWGRLHYAPAEKRVVRRVWYAPWRVVVLSEAKPARMAATCSHCGYSHEWRPGTLQSFV